MPSWRQKTLVLLLALPLLGFVLFEGRFFLGYFETHRMPEKFLLNDAFSGWVVVTYGDASCPPAVETSGFRVIEVSAAGESCVSSPAPKGWAEDVFAYRAMPLLNLFSNPKSGVNRIWYEHSRSRQDASKAYVFYVGDPFSKEILKEQLKVLNARFSPQ